MMVREHGMYSCPVHKGFGGSLKSGFATLKQCCIRATIEKYSQTLRVVTRTWAPIFSSLTRRVQHCARASVVPASPTRRNVCGTK